MADVKMEVTWDLIIGLFGKSTTKKTVGASGSGKSSKKSGGHIKVGEEPGEQKAGVVLILAICFSATSLFSTSAADVLNHPSSLSTLICSEVKKPMKRSKSKSKFTESISLFL